MTFATGTTWNLGKSLGLLIGTGIHTTGSSVSFHPVSFSV